MTKDATEDPDSNDGDSKDTELDLDKLFEAIPSRRPKDTRESSDNGDEGSESSAVDSPFEVNIDIEGSVPESAEPELEDDDVRGEDDQDGPGTEAAADSTSGGDRPAEEAGGHRSLDELAAATGGAADRSSSDSDSRFGGLLAEIDPDTQSQDLDSLLTRLTQPQQPAETTEPTETPAVESTPLEASITFRSEESKLLGASNTLFSAPRSARTAGDICHPLFSLYSAEDRNVMLISLQESSEKRLDSFFDTQASQPANLAVVTGDDSVRSTTRSKGMDVDQDMSNISVKVVNDPGDLTRLGITISNILKTWVGNGHDTIVCFDSVSVLLQYASLQRVFRFIHVLQGRLDEVGARTHFHLDPGAHDAQTIGTLQPLFDGEVRVQDDGTLVYE